MPTKLSGALIAEFIGTFALCFIGILAIAQPEGLVGIALAHGLTLAIMVTATMPASGGHLNPAVTFGFLVTGKMKPATGVAYILSQLAAGIAASLAVCAIYGVGKGAEVVFNGTPSVGFGFSSGAALLTEIILSFFLIFSVWGTAADPRAKYVGGFAIGLTIGFDILAGGPISGASMNPARSFGPTIVGLLAPGGTLHLYQNWIYWVGPLVGGALAAMIYKQFLWPKDSAD
jgi:MIP family channel proteins